MNEIAPGSKLKLKKEIKTRWGWFIREGEMVELIQIQHQPTRFKVKDSQGRIWILDTHDVEILSKNGGGSSVG